MGRPNPAAEAENRKADARLDEALEESFPASDPPAILGEDAPLHTPKEKKDETARAAACDHKIQASRTLDEALDESFPASDPPAISQPHHPEDDEADNCPIP
ncbi:hypothetical protein V5F59_10040 [Xanthobacter autotrophicus DSM 431]|uniref:hypothetical protein n=1 Tax=Xanthobacter nonsaccharivorans TaxID=3119912 RepID=UPI0037278AA1